MDADGLLTRGGGGGSFNRASVSRMSRIGFELCRSILASVGWGDKHPCPYIEASISLRLFARYIPTKLPGLCKAHRYTLPLILQTLKHSTKPTV